MLFNFKNHSKAFTLIELLIVIAIIGVLSTLVVVALGNSRTSARDAKRLNDLKAMANALELYYADNNQYPASITPGQPLEQGGVVYMNRVPNNPTPRTDGDCPDEEYRYISNSSQGYSIIACIGSNQSSLVAGGVITTNNSGLQSVGTINGLVLYWKIENDLIDYSGNNYNATNYGTVFTEDRFGKSNSALYYNGIDNYIITDANIDFNINAGDYTATLWVYNENTDLDYWKTTIGVGTNYSLGFHVFASRYCSYNGSAAFCRNFSYAANQWRFVAIVHKVAEKKIESYVSGSKTAETIYTGNLVNTTGQKIHSGKRDASSSSMQHFQGRLDDMRIYNRALSEDEIQVIYNITQ